MNFEKHLLDQFLFEPLRLFSASFFIIRRGNPFLFSLEGIKFAAHISYIHDSGNTRTNDDEVRVQIQRSSLDKQLDYRNSGYQTCYLGFFERGDAFIAWDPAHVESKTAKTVFSEYGRISNYETATVKGADLYFQKSRVLDRHVRHPAFRSEMLGVYLQNLKAFHDFDQNLSQEKQVLDLQELVSENIEIYPSGAKSEQTIEIGREKKTITISRTGYRRSPAFSKTVRAAYGYACAICGKQMELVQAAHIIPHNHPEGSDTINNGIALCVEHHHLYDSNLILLTPEYRLRVNLEQKKFLERIGQSGGIEEVMKLENQSFNTPTEIQNRPSAENIERANAIRLGT